MDLLLSLLKKELNGTSPFFNFGLYFDFIIANADRMLLINISNTKWQFQKFLDIH